MNDLRTTATAIGGSTSAMTERDSGIVSAPPRVRPDRNDESRGGARKMSRRQSIAERARQDGADDSADGTPANPHRDPGDDPSEQTLFDDETRQRVVNAKLAERASRRDQADKGPNSRPSRRRSVDTPSSHDHDGFPWTFQSDDEDEPEELQASTPLLSRAFRAGTG